MLELDGITKRFDATDALGGVTLSLAGGEICGLVGHNGAGKSTLIRIVAGAERADAGRIRIDGVEREIGSPHQSHAAGIRVIHQDAPLVPSLDSVENCFLGRTYPRRFGVIDRRAMLRSIARFAAEIAPELPLETPVGFLSAAEKQFVRLLRAIADEGRMLILDEPTAALPAEDANRFFAVLRRMRARGTAILLVSHRLDEIASCCDRAVVLRDGHNVAELRGNELTVKRLISAMGGDHEPLRAAAVELPVAGNMLEIRDLTSGELRTPARLEVRAGEVVTLYGLAGSGRSSLLQAIWGAVPAKGTMLLEGSPYRPKNPGDAVRAGISHVPADRHRTGLFPDLSLTHNKTLPLLGTYRRHPALPLPDAKAERTAFLAAAEKVALAFRAPGQAARTLSGGNQQKLLFSRWASRHSRVMLLDEPTEGIDIGARESIKHLIRAIAADGNAVLISTSDRNEALELGDRVVVFRDGAIVQAFSRDKASPKMIAAAAQASVPNHHKASA